MKGFEMLLLGRKEQNMIPKHDQLWVIDEEDLLQFALSSNFREPRAERFL
jgi:hypothetical protein